MNHCHSVLYEPLWGMTLPWQNVKGSQDLEHCRKRNLPVTGPQACPWLPTSLPLSGAGCASCSTSGVFWPHPTKQTKWSKTSLPSKQKPIIYIYYYINKNKEKRARFWQSCRSALLVVNVGKQPSAVLVLPRFTLGSGFCDKSSNYARMCLGQISFKKTQLKSS